ERLLLRRVRTRNSVAAGELVRAAIGQPHFWFVVGQDRGPKLSLVVAGWWASIAAVAAALSGVSGALAATGLLLLPVAAMALRWRALRHGLYSVVARNGDPLSFLPGFLRPRGPPSGWIGSG